MEEASKAGVSVSDEALKEISRLAEQQVLYELQLEKLQEQVENVMEKHREVSQVLIPEAMMSVGMESFTLTDGTKVSVEKFYAAKIPEDQIVQAFAWLRKHGYDSLIKREIKCTFGKGEDKEADRVFKTLIKAGISPVDKSGVHPQTLKAFVRERMEAADKEFPQSMFGVYVGNRTKLTPATK